MAGKTRTVYVKAAHVDTWQDIDDLSRQTGKSISDLVAEGLALVLDKYEPVTVGYLAPALEGRGMTDEERQILNTLDETFGGTITTAAVKER